jgi:hypothetical protein
LYKFLFFVKKRPDILEYFKNLLSKQYYLEKIYGFAYEYKLEFLNSRVYSRAI